MARKSAVERKVIVVKERRVPLRSLLHGKEFREGIAALTEWRKQFNEDEILYGRRLQIVNVWGSEFTVEVVRDETDKEYNARQDKALKAKEAREVKAAKREAAKLQAEAEREAMLEAIKSMTVADWLEQSHLDDEDLFRYSKK